MELVSPLLPFRDPGLDLGSRVEDLLSRLTEQEKIAFLRQESPQVPRLGVAAFRTGTEALHGISWFGVATVFPQAVGLGATWNPQLLTEVATAVGNEARAMQPANPRLGLNVWAPVVNLLRDPRWGRNEEGYSEDVLLTVRLAVAYCRGLAGPDPDRLLTAPLLKHFLAYNNEDSRTWSDSVVRLRVLHEYDLPVFTRTLRDGGAVGVMPAYNRVNGRPLHTSALLARLRAEISDDLLVCSDAEAASNLVLTQYWATDHAVGHAAALLAGVDSFTDQEETSRVMIHRFEQALQRNLITMADVERAVRRLLLVRFRLGEFDPAPTSGEAVAPLPDSDSPAHRELALRAAREQVVLLRNDAGLLPLHPAPGLRVAVLGQFGQELREDFYCGTMPYRITVAAGLAEALAPTGGHVLTACGRDLVRIVADGRPLRTSHDGGPVLTEPGKEPGGYLVADWGHGVLTLFDPQAGRYLRAFGEVGVVPVTATSVHPHEWVVWEAFTRAALPGGRPGLRHIFSEKLLGLGPDGALQLGGRSVAITLEPVVDGVAEALRVAAEADVVVVVVGNEPLINGRESVDRTGLALPPDQERLVREVSAAQPDTVLVLMSSYPYTFASADATLSTVLWTSHAGQETGRALAQILLGEHSPSGRLPQTWYADDADLPDLLDYDIIKARRTYQYFEGEPLFAFGHGLTYTSFEYGPASVEHDGPIGEVPATGQGPASGEVPATGEVLVRVPVTNVGTVAGTEVVQVYGRWPADHPGQAGLPRRRLLGFARPALQPGVTGEAVIRIHLDDLALYDVARSRMWVRPGDYELLIGRSAEAIESTVRITVTGPEVGPRPLTGAGLLAASFDDCEGTTLVEVNADVTDDRPDALGLAEGRSEGWALYRDVDLTPLRAGAVLQLKAGRTKAGTARLGLRLHSRTGPLLAEFEIPATGGRYTWTTLTTTLTAATLSAAAAPAAVAPAAATPADALPARADLYLVLDGDQRLQSLTLA